MSTEKKKVIVIVGTNASGKSSLAIQLAKQFNGEVISADSRQVYRGLDIGSGKVTHSEMDGVPHRLLDVADPAIRYTAADFARDGQQALTDIISREKLPIIAGGTGFYIQSLLEPDTLPNVPANEHLRAELEQHSSDELFTQLQGIDPERASMLVDRNEQGNIRRLVRALEIALTAHEHRTPTAPTVGSVNGKALDILWIGITWEKDELEKRIRERTIQRIEHGMIEEAQRLYANGLSYERMEELGLEYRHLAGYLRNHSTKEELIENIIIGDRQYAKSQRTWFKRNPDIQWFTKETLHEVPHTVRNFLAT